MTDLESLIDHLNKKGRPHFIRGPSDQEKSHNIATVVHPDQLIPFGQASSIHNKFWGFDGDGKYIGELSAAGLRKEPFQDLLNRL